MSNLKKAFSSQPALETRMPLSSPVRRRAVVQGALVLTAALAALGSTAHAQGPRHFATLAMVAEPQTLDPMASTADLVGTIMQHVYETLYTFDAKWNVVPMLAEGMPKVSADGKTYTIDGTTATGTFRVSLDFAGGAEVYAGETAAFNG
jgi:hypothetical protein